MCHDHRGEIRVMQQQDTERQGLLAAAITGYETWFPRTFLDMKFTIAISV